MDRYIIRVHRENKNDSGWFKHRECSRGDWLQQTRDNDTTRRWATAGRDSRISRFRSCRGSWTHARASTQELEPWKWPGHCPRCRWKQRDGLSPSPPTLVFCQCLLLVNSTWKITYKGSSGRESRGQTVNGPESKQANNAHRGWERARNQPDGNDLPSTSPDHGRGGGGEWELLPSPLSLVIVKTR